MNRKAFSVGALQGFDTTIVEVRDVEAEAQPAAVASARGARADADPWRVWRGIVATVALAFLNAAVIFLVAGQMLPGVLTAPYLWTEVGIVARAVALLVMLAPCACMLYYQSEEKRRSTWSVAFALQVAAVAAVGVFMWLRIASAGEAPEPVYLAGYPIGVITLVILGKIAFFNAIFLLMALGGLGEAEKKGGT